ncbi:DUF3592 domain-containing protein [Larkinella terrae]|uniref:DUF3592 domain-containing protein n=1 Tax=Larkinella terrae TaxID=2025311 RepID=A0A7K0EK84_9BACT|nr:DUF3592 domain-containing protein [Larkinella terrae]MRS62263.1 DUF3592 domain-containing protein [Larkinella terrae]
MDFPAGELFILLFFSVGLTLVGIGYFIFRKRRNLTRNGIAAKGIVIGLHRMERHEYPLAPSIRYQTTDGREVIFHSSEGRNPPKYRVGDEVTLYYDPKDFQHVQLAGDYLMVYVFAGMGAVFLLLSVWDIADSVGTIWQWAWSE